MYDSWYLQAAIPSRAEPVRFFELELEAGVPERNDGSHGSRAQARRKAEVESRKCDFKPFFRTHFPDSNRCFFVFSGKRKILQIYLMTPLFKGDGYSIRNGCFNGVLRLMIIFEHLQGRFMEIKKLSLLE